MIVKPKTHICPICGCRIYSAVGMCSHHGVAEPEDWAVGNRAMCDFVHRGKVQGRQPLTPEEMWWYTVDWGQR